MLRNILESSIVCAQNQNFQGIYEARLQIQDTDMIRYGYADSTILRKCRIRYGGDTLVNKYINMNVWSKTSITDIKNV